MIEINDDEDLETYDNLYKNKENISLVNNE